MDPGVRAGPCAGCAPARPPCAPRAGRAAARRGEGRALGRWSPGPSAGSGGRGRDVTAGRGRGSGRAGGEAGEVFSSFKKAGGRARPCVRARLRGSELAGTVSHRAGEGGRARGAGAGAHLRAPAARHPAGLPGPPQPGPATRAHAPHDVSPGRAALSPGRRASAGGEASFLGRPGPARRRKTPAPPAPPPAPPAAAAAAWMPSTSFPVPSKFPLGPPAAVCGSGETLGPSAPAGGTMKSAEEGKPERPQPPAAAPGGPRPRALSPAPVRPAPGWVPARGGASRPVQGPLAGRGAGGRARGGRAAQIGKRCPPGVSPEQP